MKRFLLALSFVLSLALGAADAGLLKTIPEKYDIALLTDVSKLLRSPVAKSILEDKDVIDATAELEQAGVSINDIKAILVFSKGDKFGTAVKVSDGGKIRKALDASPTREDFSVEAMQLNGLRIYRFSTRGRSERPVCTFVSSDVILGADTIENLEAFIGFKKISDAAAKKLASDIPAGIAFWGIWTNPEPAPAPKPDGNEAGYVESVRATLDFTGKDLSDIDLTSDIVCGDENFAASLGMMIPGYISIGSGVVFADAPELGEELIRGFKSRAKGKNLHLSLHLSRKLVDHIVKFSTKTAKAQISGAAEPAPAEKPVPAEKPAPAEKPVPAGK